jgi:hypothetical protein
MMLKVVKYHDTRIEHQHCHIFALDLIVFFCFCLFVFFIDTSMAVAEEHFSLFNEDNQENCSNSGLPCGSIEDI